MANVENNPGVKSRPLEVYGEFNKYTAVGWLAAGILVPPIAPLAITMALVDGGQYWAIQHYNRVDMKPGQAYQLPKAA